MASAAAPDDSTASLPAGQIGPVKPGPHAESGPLALRVELSEWGGGICEALGTKLTALLAALESSQPAGPEVLAAYADALREICEGVECSALHAAGSVAASLREKEEAEKAAAAAKYAAAEERTRIVNVRGKLGCGRIAKKRRGEYETLAAVVAKKNACAKSVADIAAIEKETVVLRRKEARLKKRKKRTAEEFALLVRCVEELEKSIEGDLYGVDEEDGDEENENVGEDGEVEEEGEVPEVHMQDVQNVDPPKAGAEEKKAEDDKVEVDTVMTTE